MARTFVLPKTFTPDAAARLVKRLAPETPELTKVKVCLHPDSLWMPLDLAQASATTLRDTGEPVVLVSPGTIRLYKVHPLRVLFTLAHETGHIVLGHVYNKPTDAQGSIKQELDADVWAARRFKALGLDMQEPIAEYRDVAERFPEQNNPSYVRQGSDAHPTTDERIAAIQQAFAE